MRVVAFQYSARTGHFLRAESGSSWLTYPFPPRTALLGLIGAILGLEKDSPQDILKGAHLAVSGAVPKTHWHKAQLRQEVYSVGRKFSATKEDNAKLQNQEWLWCPSYLIFAALPEDHQSSFEKRLEEKSYYFSPCMGMSEMFALIDYKGAFDGHMLPEGELEICSVFPRKVGKMNVKKCLSQELALSYTQMPYDVTLQRDFSLKDYVYERDGKPIPIRTDSAWKVGEYPPIVFL